MTFARYRRVTSVPEETLYVALSNIQAEEARDEEWRRNQPARRRHGR